jgi:hypothetical protein
MDIEHFGFLSSVFRKRKSHEQDGETLRARCASNKTAAGDPAMALRSSFRLARTDLSVRPSRRPFVFEHELFRKPVSAFRDHAPAATQRRVTPAYSARGFSARENA